MVLTDNNIHGWQCFFKHEKHSDWERSNLIPMLELHSQQDASVDMVTF